MDAAEELEKLLAQHPGEARAHFSLASLYVDELMKPEFARLHYRKVLELAPATPASVRDSLLAGGQSVRSTAERFPALPGNSHLTEFGAFFRTAYRLLIQLDLSHPARGERSLRQAGLL